MTFLFPILGLQSLEKIICFCKELQESNMHTSPLSFTLSCALEAKKTGTAHAVTYMHLLTHRYIYLLLMHAHSPIYLHVLNCKQNIKVCQLYPVIYQVIN